MNILQSWLQYVLKTPCKVLHIFFLQLSYPGILCWYQTNQSMCCKGRVEKSHVKLKALQFLPWSGKSNRMINHMQPSPTAKLTSLKIQSMWEQPWRLQMRSSRTLVHTNAQYQFHQIYQIISVQTLLSRVCLHVYLFTFYPHHTIFNFQYAIYLAGVLKTYLQNFTFEPFDWKKDQRRVIFYSLYSTLLLIYYLSVCADACLCCIESN